MYLALSPKLPSYFFLNESWMARKASKSLSSCFEHSLWLHVEKLNVIVPCALVAFLHVLTVCMYSTLDFRPGLQDVTDFQAKKATIELKFIDSYGHKRTVKKNHNLQHDILNSPIRWENAQSGNPFPNPPPVRYTVFVLALMLPYVPTHIWSWSCIKYRLCQMLT